jgi:hypothetical protein
MNLQLAKYEYNFNHMQKKTVKELNSCQILSKTRILRKLEPSSCKISSEKQYQKVDEINHSKISPIIHNQKAYKQKNRNISPRRN